MSPMLPELLHIIIIFIKSVNNFINYTFSYFGVFSLKHFEQFVIYNSISHRIEPGSFNDTFANKL